MRSLTILGTVVVTAMVAVVPYGTNDAHADGTRTLRFYEHDTQQASIDLGDPGVSPGDEFLFSGDLFDHRGGTNSAASPGAARR